VALTDEATASYKRNPIVDGKRTAEAIGAIRNLGNLVAQEMSNYVAGLKNIDAISWTKFHRPINVIGATRDLRSGLSSLVIEHIEVGTPAGRQEFDVMWASSLTDATCKGKSDAEAVSTSATVATLNEFIQVTA